VANAVVTLGVIAAAATSAPKLLLGLVVAAAISAPLEALLPLRRAGRRTLRGYAADLTAAVGNRSLILPLATVAFAAAAPAVHTVVPEAARRTLEHTGTGAHLAILFVLSDLANYWGHRSLHRIGWLWRFHAVHHSSRQVDWLATARGHPIDQALNLVAAGLPIYALGATSVANAFVAFLFLYPFLLHAAVDVRLPWLERVIVTPRFHRWHHGAEEAAHDRNFGAILTVWDHLFGTAGPSQGIPQRCGIDGDPPPSDYLGLLLVPLRRRRA
jgi:sterol desaturase/sphingolipid hydroxylase (fatty acid hydroxylase superfamily)